MRLEKEGRSLDREVCEDFMKKGTLLGQDTSTWSCRATTTRVFGPKTGDPAEVRPSPGADEELRDITGG